MPCASFHSAVFSSTSCFVAASLLSLASNATLFSSVACACAFCRAKWVSSKSLSSASRSLLRALSSTSRLSATSRFLFFVSSTASFVTPDALCFVSWAAAAAASILTRLSSASFMAASRVTKFIALAVFLSISSSLLFVKKEILINSSAACVSTSCFSVLASRRNSFTFSDTGVEASAAGTPDASWTNPRAGQPPDAPDVDEARGPDALAAPPEVGADAVAPDASSVLTGARAVLEDGAPPPNSPPPAAWGGGGGVA
mmetsp:Transcript_29422/g.73416  ORF Transcript_29422/g.73416 Transcript_29422/m.73416 type:complete len:257 (+) Transcript_29422:266-1036(+)